MADETPEQPTDETKDADTPENAESTESADTEAGDAEVAETETEEAAAEETAETETEETAAAETETSEADAGVWGQEQDHPVRADAGLATNNRGPALKLFTQNNHRCCCFRLGPEGLGGTIF